MVSLMRVHALIQVPGMDQPQLTVGEWLQSIWSDMGFMRYPLLFCLALGILVIIWKLVDLGSKGSKTRKILKTVDELLVQSRMKEAIEVTRDSNAPAANILYAGLERQADACIGCSAPCAGACPHGVPIQQRTSGAHALLTLV